MSDELAALAVGHRDTLQVGRSLLQQGAVTTFGLACAVRMAGVDAALAGLAAATDALPAQLGGAVGTLATGGVPLLERFAAELGLPAPVTPWHPTRGPVARLAAAAGVLAGELAGVATDLVLLASTGIGEVTPGRPGGSSAMPHKRNASRATLALACAHRVPGLVGTVLAGMPQALQRDAGRWQAEWGTLTDLLRLVGGTARHAAAALDGVQVHPDVMRRHVDALLAVAGGDGAAGSAGELVDRALEAGDDRLMVHYLEYGDPDAPVLVTSPSVGQHPAMWARQLDAFAARFRLIMLEHRGHAGDPPPGPYTIDDVGRDALHTLDSLGVGEFSFCGLSLGGMTGMWLASEVPGRVRRLALCCTSAHLPPADFWLGRARRARADGMASLADEVVVRWFTPAFAAAHPEVVAASRQSFLDTPTEGYAGCCEAIAGMDLRDRLPSITAPTLVLAGADDPATPVPHAELIAAGVTGAELVVVPDVSHLAPLAAPEACTPLLLGHLA